MFDKDAWQRHAKLAEAYYVAYFPGMVLGEHLLSTEKANPAEVMYAYLICALRWSTMRLRSFTASW